METKETQKLSLKDIYTQNKRMIDEGYTELFTVQFKNGRIFHVNCENRSQKRRFMRICVSLHEYIQDMYEEVNGIHTIKQFENFMEDPEMYL